MKFRKVLPVLMVAACLTGCAKEVSYADFNAAAKAVEAITYTYASVTLKGKASHDGTVETVNQSYKYTKGLLAWTPTELDWTSTFLSLIVNSSPAGVAEHEDAKYYAGGSFKFVYGTDTYEWNGYGYATKYVMAGESENYTVTLSWHK